VASVVPVQVRPWAPFFYSLSFIDSFAGIRFTSKLLLTGHGAVHIIRALAGLIGFIAGWSSLAARRAHNPKVVGSNPAPATNYLLGLQA
jgi:hypothetical protein